MASTIAGVATLQLAATLGVAFLRPADLVAEHCLAVAAWQLHLRLGHAEV